MDAARRALLVRATYSDGEVGRWLGHEGYSYRYVYQAFAPLLERWGRTEEVTGPEAALDEATRRCRAAGLEPLHLCFLPLHLASRTEYAPNVAAIAWEYPEVPRTDLRGDPRNNWVKAADGMDLVLAHTHYARDALVQSGTRVPVHVVPIPIDPAYFQVPPWRPGQSTVLDVPCYVFPPPDDNSTGPAPAQGTVPAPPSQGPRGLLKKATALAPARLRQSLRRGVRAARLGWRAARAALAEADVRKAHPPLPHLELSGIVYVSIFNLLDGRKNWIDLLLAFLHAFRDCPDAQLVVKLVVSAANEAEVLGHVHACCQRAVGRYHCRVAFVTAYLSDAQLVHLAEAGTYYLNASHAEGSCLPLQGFLAAGRPAVAPGHTGLADSVADDCAFVVAAHPEPTCFPIDLGGPNVTYWYRLVWQSLHDQLRASYLVARNDPDRYAALADAGRRRIAHLAAPESVWPVLASALDQAAATHARAPRRAG